MLTGFSFCVYSATGAAFDYWTEHSDTNIWEHCGLFEGDIMLHRELLRNGLLNERLTWPDAAVPFYIDPQDFSEYPDLGTHALSIGDNSRL